MGALTSTQSHGGHTDRTDGAASETTCKCGHDGSDHRPWAKGTCSAIVNERSWLDFDLCPCSAYDVSRLPADGERLEFGRHRMNIPDAETAPAWPSLGVVQGRLDARYIRQQRKAEQALR